MACNARISNLHYFVVMYEIIFSKKGLSLERLQTLVQVAQAGGVTKAAQGNPVHQSLYSRQLKDLGKYFHAELVQKEGRTLKLTPLGQKISAVSLDYFSFLAQILNQSGKSAHPLSIGTGNILTQWVLPAIVADLHRIFSIPIRCSCLRTRDVISQITEGILDLGIVRKDDVPDHLDQMNAGAIEYRLYVPRALLPKYSRAPDLATVLKTVPLAAMDAPGDYNDAVEALARKYPASTGIQFRYSSMANIFAMIQEGACAGILPSLISKELASTTCWELNCPETKGFRRPLALCWRKRLVEIRDDTQKIIEFIARGIRTKLDATGGHSTQQSCTIQIHQLPRHGQHARLTTRQRKIPNAHQDNR